MERAAPALRRRRRRRDERLRARRARARGAAQRLRRRRLALSRAPARGRRAGRRASATTRRTSRPGDDVEVVYSSAVPADNPERVAARERGLRERPRAELLAELTALKRTIAVAGTHGKTTTASMLVHALRAAGGADPAWLVGGAGRGRAAQRALGRRGVARRRGRRVRPLDAEPRRRDRGADERRARPPRDVRLAARAARGVPRVPGARARRRRRVGSARAARAAPRRARSRWSPTTCPRRGCDAGGSRFRLARRRGAPARSRARTTRSTPPRRSRRRGSSGPTCAAALAGLAGFRGAGRRFQALGARRRRGAASTTTTRTTRPRSRRRCARRARSRTGGWWRSSSRTCTRAPQLLAREFGRALALADVVVVLDVYPARERAEEHPGGQRAAGRAGRRRRRRRSGRSTGCRRSPTRSRCCGVLLGAGDLCLVMGAGDVDALGRRSGGRAMSVPAPPAGVRRDYPLARLATVRTGGAARLFARAGSEAELLELLAWARAAARADRGRRLGLEPADRRRGRATASSSSSTASSRGSSARGSGACAAAAARGCRRSRRGPRRRAWRASSSASTSPGPSAARCG